MCDMKTIFVPFQAKSEAKSKAEEISGDNKLKGYASVFDVIDSHNDRVVRGAFKTSISSGQMPKFLWQHNEQDVIGVWTHITEDEHGLYVEGELIEDIQKAKEAKALIQKNAVSGLSIGYRVKKAMRGQEQTAVRLLTEVELLEISLVTFPSNKDASLL